MGWWTDTKDWFSDRYDDTTDALGDLHNGVTGKTASRAATNAAGIQAKSATEAQAEAHRQYDLTREDQSPWLNIGKQNLGKLNEGLASGSFDTPDPGSYNPNQYQDPGSFKYGEFNPGDLENDPGYKFRMAQGLKGIQNTRAGSGSLKSGATLKALLGYGQGLASEEMGNAYNRFSDQRNFANNVYQNNRTFGRNTFETDRNFGANQFQQSYQNRVGANQDRFNRLASIAGVGQQAAQNLGAHGANFAQNTGNNLMAGANAQAAGQVGAANAQTGAFNNLLQLGASIYGAG
jgi:hypothetical protein